MPGSASFHATLPCSGVPVIQATPRVGENWLQPRAQSLLWSTMYSADPAESWTAGTGVTRDESGPRAEPFTGLAPATICDFSKTQVDWPRKNWAFWKSFQESTTLSELTPILGWSWVR